MIKEQRKFYFSYISIFLLAFILRIIHLIFVSSENWYFKVLLSDSYVYVKKALQILQGNFLFKNVFYQDPLYPIFLAFIFRINKIVLFDVCIIQIFLSSLSCVGIFYIGTKIWNKKVGIISGILASIYPVWIYYDSLILKTSLVLFFLTYYIVFIVRNKKSSFYISSFLLGIMCLIRGNFLLFIPFHFIFYFYKKKQLKEYFFAFSILILVFIPITYSNFRAGKEFVLITSQAGQNLYTGNNEYNVSGYYKPVPFVRPSALFEEKDFKKEAERRTGQSMKAAQLSKFWAKETFNFLKKEPKKFFTNIINKLTVYFDYYEVPDNYDYYFLKNKSFIHYLSYLTFPLLFALTIMSCFLKKNTEEWYLITLAFIYSFSVILFFIYSRYRMPVVIFTILFSGKMIYETCKLRNVKVIIKYFVLILFIFFILSYNPTRQKVDIKQIEKIIENRKRILKI